jgi:Holliday junction resolvasome RuvABC DNA-binding subunit
VQIDLLFDRQDNAVTLCEIKYRANKYVVDKADAKDLQRKMNVFQFKTKTSKQLFLALITVNGVKKIYGARVL